MTNIDESSDAIPQDIEVEPVEENIAINKIAFASQDYPEYGITAGDPIGFGTYYSSYDQNNFMWNEFINSVPTLKAINHYWEVCEDGNSLPEIKTINT